MSQIVVGDSRNPTFIDGFDASADFLVPRLFDFGDTTRRLQIEQRAGEGEALLFRQANCLKSQFFDAGHVCTVFRCVGASMPGPPLAFREHWSEARQPRKFIAVTKCVATGEAGATATFGVTSCQSARSRPGWQCFTGSVRTVNGIGGECAPPRQSTPVPATLTDGSKWRQGGAPLSPGCCKPGRQS